MWLGGFRHGWAGSGLISARRASTLPARFLGTQLRCGQVGFVRARKGRFRRVTDGSGGARLGRVRSGLGCRRQRGGATLPAALSGADHFRYGSAGQISVMQGRAVSGPARADDLSTEPLGALCWVLWNLVRAWLVSALSVVVRLGGVGSDMALLLAARRVFLLAVSKAKPGKIEIKD